MSKTILNKSKNSILYIIYAGILSFIIGFINYKWFAHFYFDGDSAAYQLLATAIFDEHSLLVKDFYYGNQLILLRTNSLFMAIVMNFGLIGYDVFLFGSALSVTLWGIILYFTLNVYFENSKKSLLFLILLLIPLGVFDSYYIFGQQSHLSNVILCLGIVLFFHKYYIEKELSLLLLACLYIFIIIIEAPIRGLLLIFPLLLVLFFTNVERKNIYRILHIVTITIVFGILVNIYLKSFVEIKIDPMSVTLKTTSDILDNFIKIFVREFFDAISNLNIFQNKKITLIIVLYLLSAFYIFSYVFCLLKSFKLLRIVRYKQTELFRNNFLYLVIAIGFITNMIITLVLYPYTMRHMLWVLFLMKFVIFLYIYNFIVSKQVNVKYCYIIPLAFVILNSTWVAVLSKNRGYISNEIKNMSYRIISNEVDIISQKYNIKNIYGNDFWKMQPINTYSNNSVKSAIILFNKVDGKVFNFNFLIRPSMYCKNSNEKVMYYFKTSDSDDNIMKEKVKQQPDSFEAKVGNDYSIWVGKPIWEIPENCRDK